MSSYPKCLKNVPLVEVTAGVQFETDLSEEDVLFKIQDKISTSAGKNIKIDPTPHKNIPSHIRKSHNEIKHLPIIEFTIGELKYSLCGNAAYISIVDPSTSYNWDKLFKNIGDLINIIGSIEGLKTSYYSLKYVNVLYRNHPYDSFNSMNDLKLKIQISEKDVGDSFLLLYTKSEDDYETKTVIGSNEFLNTNKEINKDALGLIDNEIFVRISDSDIVSHKWFEKAHSQAEALFFDLFDKIYYTEMEKEAENE